MMDEYPTVEQASRDAFDKLVLSQSILGEIPVRLISDDNDEKCPPHHVETDDLNLNCSTHLSKWRWYCYTFFTFSNCAFIKHYTKSKATSEEFNSIFRGYLEYEMILDITNQYPKFMPFHVAQILLDYIYPKKSSLQQQEEIDNILTGVIVRGTSEGLEEALQLHPVQVLQELNKIQDLVRKNIKGMNDCLKLQYGIALTKFWKPTDQDRVKIKYTYIHWIDGVSYSAMEDEYKDSFETIKKWVKETKKTLLITPEYDLCPPSLGNLLSEDFKTQIQLATGD